MICKRRGEGWEIVFQRNHALLSAEMLAPWREEKRPQPWAQLLNATAQHDHGWREDIDDALIDEHGHPLDFLHMPISHAQAIQQRNLSNADSQSRWCSILVARHAQYLAGFKEDEEARIFADQVEVYRRSRMEEIAVSDDHVNAMYELLCWADTLSLLVLCQASDWTRSLKLQAQGLHFQLEQRQETVWTLDPWPYRVEVVKLDYETRYLEQDTFASADDLRNTLLETPVVIRRLELRRP